MKGVRIILKILIVAVLVIVKTVSAIVVVTGLLWAIYTSGPYDGIRSKTVAPASSEVLNTLDD